MESKIILRDKLALELRDLKEKDEQMRNKSNEITNSIRTNINNYNGLITNLQEMRKEYKNSLKEYNQFANEVKEYKSKQIPFLTNQYKDRICNIIEKINSLTFELKITIFNNFDELKIIKTDIFPNLDKKIEIFYDEQKFLLKSKLLDNFENTEINETIFYIHFIVKYEDYFKELILFKHLFLRVENKFEYHFMTDKKTNRLDKPEWIFEFLLEEFKENEKIIELYLGIKEQFYEMSNSQLDNLQIYKKVTENTPDYIKNVSFRGFALLSIECLHSKLYEIVNLQSDQKRNLIIHFANQFIKFYKAIEKKYNFKITTSEVECVLSSIQNEYLISELSKIHNLNYVQWFREYKRLAKETLQFIGTYSILNPSFVLDDLIGPITEHIKNLISNLRFINREEITIVCYLFSELEELKNFILEEEINLRMNFLEIGEDISGDSIDSITHLNSEILNLIKNLAINDIENLLKKIYRFIYTSSETKRLFIVECNQILEQYKMCSHFKSIENVVASKIDEFLLENLIFKERFNSEDYLEFRVFYKKLKILFQKYTWQSDEGFMVLDGIFEGKTNENENGKVFKRIKILYE